MAFKKSRGIALFRSLIYFSYHFITGRFLIPRSIQSKLPFHPPISTKPAPALNIHGLRRPGFRYLATKRKTETSSVFCTPATLHLFDAMNPELVSAVPQRFSLSNSSFCFVQLPLSPDYRIFLWN
jgi:hypothetical protein